MMKKKLNKILKLAETNTPESENAPEEHTSRTRGINPDPRVERNISFGRD